MLLNTVFPMLIFKDSQLLFSLRKELLLLKFNIIKIEKLIHLFDSLKKITLSDGNLKVKLNQNHNLKLFKTQFLL